MRGAANAGANLEETVRGLLAGLVASEDIAPIPPSLEDVFVLKGEEDAEAA